jgi:hypothetical protein
MVNVVVNSTFIDIKSGKEIYAVSIQTDDKYYTIYLSKEEFNNLTSHMISIRDNVINNN